jgi:NAD(P)H dehydrogenase (quinone)
MVPTYTFTSFLHIRAKIHSMAIVICSAGHTLEHLEQIGVAESMKHIMLEDRLLGIGVKQARMEILGGMMPKDDTYGRQNLEKAYHPGRNL